MANISLYNGANVRFKLSFEVPAGNSYDQIIVTDVLETGVEFIDTTTAANNVVSFTVDGTPETLANFFTPTITASDSLQPTILDKITFTSVAGSALFNPTTNKVVEIILEVTIPDITELTMVEGGKYILTNDYTVTAYKDNNVQDEETGTLDPVEVNDYNLYGFGNGNTLNKNEPKVLPFTSHLPTFDGYSAKNATGAAATAGSPMCAAYKLTLDPENTLNITFTALPADAAEKADYINKIVKVYAQNSSGKTTMIPYRSAATINGFLFDENDYTTNELITVTVPHYDQLRSDYLYVTAWLKSDVYTGTELKLHSPVSAQLIDTCDGNRVLDTANPFDVLTTVNDTPKQLMHVTKTLVL